MRDVGLTRVAVHHQRDALAQLVQQLGRGDDPGVLPKSEHPGDQLPGVRILSDEQQAGIVVFRVAAFPVATEMPLDLPRDPAADPDLRGADRIAELPVDPIGVRARVEIGGTLEVVLGLGRVAHLAADPGEAEDADRLAFMGACPRRRTGRPGRAADTDRPCARRPRRAPSCSSRTRSSCGGRSPSRSWPGAGRCRGRRRSP